MGMFVAVVKGVKVERKVLTFLSCLTNQELDSQQVVYRKLMGEGYHREAYLLLNMGRVEYEDFICNHLDEVEG